MGLWHSPDLSVGLRVQCLGNTTPRPWYIVAETLEHFLGSEILISATRDGFSQSPDVIFVDYTFHVHPIRKFPMTTPHWSSSEHSPFGCSPSLLWSAPTSSSLLPLSSPRANPPSLTLTDPPLKELFSGSQSFTLIEGGSHFLGEGEFGRLRTPRLGAEAWELWGKDIFISRLNQSFIKIKTCWFQNPIRLVSPPEDIVDSLSISLFHLLDEININSIAIPQSLLLPTVQEISLHYLYLTRVTERPFDQWQQ